MVSSAPKTAYLAGGLTLIMALVGVSRICFSADSSQTLRLRAVYNGIGRTMAPIWVAQEAGLFTKHGLDVQLNYLAATTSVQAMVGETEDVGLVGNQGIDANLEGATWSTWPPELRLSFFTFTAIPVSSLWPT